VQVTQTVEIVAGDQSRLLDTCLVLYRLENLDQRPHDVGLRFMLDTYIGANDGVPFTLPDEKDLCDTLHDYDKPEKVPAFVQALEKEDLLKPGTIAHLKLRLGGRIEAPSRVTLGAWPDRDLREKLELAPNALAQNTLWDVPLISMKTLSPPDSAVTMYWNPKPLAHGDSRDVGFAYGIGSIASGEGGGRLALTVDGSFTPGGEITLTAYVRQPEKGQTVALVELPPGFEIIDGDAKRTVPPLSDPGKTKNSPVTWRLRAPGKTGSYTLKVRSSTGVTQTQPVVIKPPRLFK
jgi:hypothetical protein